MPTMPFIPVPYPASKALAVPFRGAGYKLTRMFPKLETELHQANIKIPLEDYGGLMGFALVFYFLFFSVLLSLLLTKFVFTGTKLGPVIIPNAFFIGIGVGLVMAVLVFVQLVAYPKIMVKKRVRLIESNLIFALRNMLVQLKSGVSLFNSLCLIAYSKRYGELGAEIKIAVDKINSGVSEEDALRELGDKNPSSYLKKVIWQVVNGMRAGSDISDVLQESVSTITREQRIDIERYGNSLRILSLMYLMIGVIIPALGLTFMIVIGSFPKIKLNEWMFWGFLGLILLAQFMFVGIMKSKRPSLMGQ